MSKFNFEPEQLSALQTVFEESMRSVRDETALHGISGAHARLLAGP
jgi:hypothetical protein